MKKPRIPSPEHIEVLKSHGLKHYLYEVMKDTGMSLIIRHRITGEFRLIEKGGAPK